MPKPNVAACLKIRRREPRDAFHDHLFRVHPDAVGEPREHGCLVRGVPAIDVERLVRLSVPEPLGLGEHAGVRRV